MAEKITIVFIVGPTASGKSELAMKLAVQYNGEIVCADSQTVRRGLDIGTAKPSASERASIPHHMLDIIEPYDSFSVAEFKTKAEKAIKDIQKRGKLPIIVGGTGLYVDAILYDFQFRRSNSEYSRPELEKLKTEDLQQIIKDKSLLMPENMQNPRHLIRTIESEGQVSKKGKRIKDSVIVGIDPGKDVLQTRIQERIQKMLKGGLLDEIERIIERYGQPPTTFDAIGYKIALDCRDKNGNFDKDEITRRFTQSDKNYAKSQRTWFKRNKNINWFEHTDEAYFYLENLLQMH